MCGIWFSLGIDAPRAAIRSVAHRGPDGEGWEVHQTPVGPLTMGHRRLAILDLSDNGRQPMTSSSDRFRIVYNGEIYNYRELRKELKGLGASFRTNCDTEVLLVAYETWGAACLGRLNGMFAFVIWDMHNDSLFAARDRFGIKPLYMLRRDNSVMFASEIKQFFRVPGVNARPNETAIMAYLSYGVIDHGHETLFADIEQVPPGWSVKVDFAGQRKAMQIDLGEWYCLHDRLLMRPAVDVNMESAAATFRELLEDSIKLRLRSDVPVGSCLSGGLDSSSIVCLAQGIGAKEHKTISACYDNWDMDERPFINAVNEAAGTTPIFTFPDADGFVTDIDDIIAHQDHPVGSSSVYAQWCVFRAAADAGLKVVLDGQGADEQLAGYMPAISSYHAGLFASGNLGILLREMSAASRRHDGSVFSYVVAMAKSLVRQRVSSGHRAFARSQPWLVSERRPRRPMGDSGSLKTLLFDQFTRSTLPALLRYEDRNSMAFGMEARLPFMDYRIVEYVFSLNDGLKISKGETKAVMRRAMQDVLPRIVLNRQRKIGFATPEAQWFIEQRAEEALDAGRREAVEIFPNYFVDRELCKLFSGDKDDQVKRRAQWRVFALSRWGRVFGVSG